MILLVDLGNTRIKWASLVSGKIRFEGASPYKNCNLEEILEKNWQQLGKPEQIWVANVAGDTLGELLRLWVKEVWDMPINFAHSVSRYKEVINAYAEPGRLGIDRWLNIIAARQIETFSPKKPICVIDGGSFLTIDLIDANGLHLGGYITPGLEMMYAALFDYSQGRLKADRPARFTNFSLGKNTQDCMINGCTQMLIAFINQVTADIEKTLAEDLFYVITGGDAEIFLPCLHKNYQHHPALVFEGLALIVALQLQSIL